jgi:alkylhydroperoxidase family enzyme
MPQISEVDYAAASPEQRAAHDDELRLRGRMTNMKRTLLHSPVALRVYGEWFALRGELEPVIGDRALFIFAHAISKAGQSLTGATFMRRALIQMGIDPDALVLSQEELALVHFGAAIAHDPNHVEDDAWAPLKARYNEKTLVDLVAFAGIQVATNLFMSVVGTRFDAELLQFAERPISPSRE